MLNKKYVISRENIIKSFNYSDLVSGLSYGRLYLSTFNTPTDYGLTQFTIINNAGLINATQTLDTAPYNLTQTLKGVIYAQFHITNIGTQGTFTASIKFQKYDGTTATDITGSESLSYYNSSTTEVVERYFAVSLPLTDITTIEEGSMIRLSLTITGDSGVVGATETTYIDIPYEVVR